MARRTLVRLATLAGIASIWMTGLAVVAAPPAARAQVIVGYFEVRKMILPEYRAHVNAPESAWQEPYYTGRGSWNDLRYGYYRELAAPLFRVAAPGTGPSRNSIILTNIANATKLRAAIDGVTESPSADGCRGGTSTERAALTAFIWNGTSWGSATGSLVEHEGEGGGSGCRYRELVRPDVGWTKVMFVVDLYCRDTIDDGSDACDGVSGEVAGASSLAIEFEGSGDGVYNSGLASTTAIDAEVLSVGPPGTWTRTVTFNAPGHGLLAGDHVTIDDYTSPCYRESLVVAMTPTPTPDGFTASVAGGCTPDLGATSLLKLQQLTPLVTPRDVQFEIMLGTDRVERFDGADMVNGLTNDRDEFLDRTGNAYEQWTGLMSVPACDDSGPEPDSGPCLQSPSAGWELTMIDEPNGIRLRPWRSEAPFFVTPTTSVSYQLRMPRSDAGAPFRGYVLGADITETFSILSSSARIDSYGYATGDGYSVTSLTVSASDATAVTLFGGASNEMFFEDRCSGYLSVTSVGQVPYLETNGIPGKQAEENTDDCQNESSGFVVDQVSLWGDPSGDDDRAWIRAPGHDLAVGDVVAVCCAYGAFDGRNVVVAVGNPYTGVVKTETGATPTAYPLTHPHTWRDWWFAISTANHPDYEGRSFPSRDGDGDVIESENVRARVVKRDHVRVTTSRRTLDVNLSQPYPFDPEANDNNHFLAGSYISTNAQAVAQGPGMTRTTQPVFDFALAGPSRTEAGQYYPAGFGVGNNVGFFRACIPAGFLQERWGGISPSAAVVRLANRRASLVTNRDGGVQVTTATCGLPGGILVVLPQFGFSAPYFAIDPNAPLADSGVAPVDSGTSGGPSCGAPPLPSCGLPAGIVLGPGGTIQNPGALSAADIENLRPENMTGFRPADVRALNPDALRNFRPDLIASIPAAAMRALDPARLAALPPAALSAFDAAKVSAMPPSAMAGLGPDQVASLPPAALGSIRFAQVAAIPPSAMQGLTADRVTALPPAAIQGFGPAQLVALPPQSIAGLMPAQVAALAPAMARVLAPAQVAALPPQSIASMTPGAFRALSAEAIASLTPEQRSALPAEAFDPPTLARPATSSTISSLVGSISGWNVDQVPPSAFGGLRPSDVARMANDAFTALAPAQVAAVPPRALSGLAPAQAALLPPEALASLRPAQVAALSPQVIAAMSPAQVAALPSTAVASLRPNQAAQLPVAAIEALGTAQVAALPPGSIARLDAEQVSALQPAVISALTAQQVAALRPASLSGLEPDQAAALPESALRRVTGAQLGGLTPSAFGGLGTQQLVALPPSAFRGLTVDQASALTAEQSRTLAPADLRSMPAAVRAIVLRLRSGPAS